MKKLQEEREEKLLEKRNEGDSKKFTDQVNVKWNKLEKNKFDKLKK